MDFVLIFILFKQHVIMFQKAKRKENQPANGCDGQPNDGVTYALSVRLPRQFYIWQSFSAYNAFLQRGSLASSSSILTSRFSSFVRRQLPSVEQQVSRVTPASDPSRGHSLSSTSAITPTAAAPSSAAITTVVQSTGILSLVNDLIF